MQQFLFWRQAAKRKEHPLPSADALEKFYVPMILKQATFFYADHHVDVADDRIIYGCNS